MTTFIKAKEELDKKLSSFNQRKLVQGELVLLAKCISDVLPLIPPEVQTPKMFVLGHRNVLDSLFYHLREHAHLTDDQFNSIEELVIRFLIWRTSVAKGNCSLLFTGDTDLVVDELSGLPRLIDPVVMCSLGEIADKANHLLSLFKSLSHYHYEGQEYV